MHAVVNRIRLKEPIADEAFREAETQMPARAAAVDGLRAVRLIRAGDELLVVILADHEAALEAFRESFGNAWMRENVIPHAAGPPERLVGEVVASYDRD